MDVLPFTAYNAESVSNVALPDWVWIQSTSPFAKQPTLKYAIVKQSKGQVLAPVCLFVVAAVKKVRCRNEGFQFKVVIGERLVSAFLTVHYDENTRDFCPGLT